MIIYAKDAQTANLSLLRNISQLTTQKLVDSSYFYCKLNFDFAFFSKTKDFSDLT